MYTLASELFHTHWSRGALCEMSSWCTPRGPSWFVSHVSMCWLLRSCNPSWFVCNILVCRRSTAYAFICQCHWGSSKPLNFIMYAWWKHRPSSPSLLSLSSFLSCSHRVAPASSSWNLSCISTEHIPKYSSIEIFLKLPFQRVVIRFKRSPNEGVMPVLL